MERLGAVIEQAPEDWIKTHAEPLYLRYNVNLLFSNKEYLASVDNATRKKLLLLFLALVSSDFYDGVSDSAVVFLIAICGGKFIDELDPETIKNLIYAIQKELIEWGDQSSLVRILFKIFLVLFARTDALLCQPHILEIVISDIDEPLDDDSFPSYAKNASDDYLMQLLEHILQAWGQEESAFPGNFPYLLMSHFLYKEHCEELLRRFLIVAPYHWLKKYWLPLEVIAQSCHADEFLYRSDPKSPEDQKIIDKIASLGRLWR